MIVFIDESGDTGVKVGSSPHFCISAVAFSSDFSANACDREIDELRRSLNKSAQYEFHFSKCPDSIRECFLKRISKQEFAYYGLAIDKNRLFSDRLRTSKNLYEFAVNIVCQNAASLLKDAKVVIDRNGDRAFLLRLQSSLKLRLNLPENQAIRKVVMEDSHRNNLLQLADMTCGALARSITKNDDRWRNILRACKRERRVQVWPK